MISRPMYQGSVGVARSCTSSLALLQVTDNYSQARAILTEQQLMRLIGLLGKLEQDIRELRIATEERGP